MNNFIAGGIGGFVGTTLNTPADVWKSRAQSMPAGQKVGWTFIEIGKIAKNEGVGALYRGFVRSFPFFVILGEERKFGLTMGMCFNLSPLNFTNVDSEGTSTCSWRRSSLNRG